MREVHGESVLLSPVWNWGPYYVSRVESALLGAWKSTATWSSLLKNNSLFDISGFSTEVSSDVIDRVNESYIRITSGLFNIFAGPLYDNSGNLVLADGEIPDDYQLFSMDYLVAGITEAPAPE